MHSLLALATQAGQLLKQREQTIAVAESSSGGLIAAALLSVPGASKYFLGAAVVYTQQARELMLNITPADMADMRSASQPYASLLATTVRRRFGSDWGIAETGAAGPTGNRYGDSAGHCCLALSGPIERVCTLETGEQDRFQNMQRFSVDALKMLLKELNETS